MINELNLAYAAGLIDGEGTITLNRKNKKDKFRCPTVSVSSTTEELLVFLKNIFGGNISTCKVYQSHHKKAYHWSIHYNGVLELLEKIEPFMKEPEKKRRAILLLKEYKKVTVRNGQYTEEQIETKHAFEKEFFKNSTKVIIP